MSNALGRHASLQASGNTCRGAESIYGGHTFFRRFEFSEGRDPVPGGEYELGNGTVFGADLGVGS